MTVTLAQPADTQTAAAPDALEDTYLAGFEAGALYNPDKPTLFMLRMALRQGMAAAQQTDSAAIRELAGIFQGLGHDADWVRAQVDEGSLSEVPYFAVASAMEAPALPVPVRS